jgi:cytoskeleton protein RodZ
VQSPAATTTTPTTTVAVPAQPAVALTSAGATVTVHSPFRLTLHATGACWVEVTDPAGKSLFSTTMHAGQVQDIPAAQPIVVRLGYTPGVTISVDGVAIDLGQLAQTANVDFRTT